MQILRYDILTGDLTAAINAAVAAFPPGVKCIAVPTTLLDYEFSDQPPTMPATFDELFGASPNTIPTPNAIATLTGDVSELCGYLDYFLAISNATLAGALAAQYPPLEPPKP